MGLRQAPYHELPLHEYRHPPLLHSPTRSPCVDISADCAVEKLPEIRVYHKELRLLVKTPTVLTPEEKMHETWGRFPEEKRVGFDQVPVEYVMNHFDTTYEMKGSERCAPFGMSSPSPPPS